jgi:hypothetical protein
LHDCLHARADQQVRTIAEGEERIAARDRALRPLAGPFDREFAGIIRSTCPIPAADQRIVVDDDTRRYS